MTMGKNLVLASSAVMTGLVALAVSSNAFPFDPVDDSMDFSIECFHNDVYFATVEVEDECYTWHLMLPPGPTYHAPKGEGVVHQEFTEECVITFRVQA